jgi:hypothetical protein
MSVQRHSIMKLTDHILLLEIPGIVDLFIVENEVNLFVRTQYSRCLPAHLMTEIDPVSETLCSLTFYRMRTMDKVQKSSISEYHTPSSDPFRNHILLFLRNKKYLIG